MSISAVGIASSPLQGLSEFVCGSSFAFLVLHTSYNHAYIVRAVWSTRPHVEDEAACQRPSFGCFVSDFNFVLVSIYSHIVLRSKV